MTVYATARPDRATGSVLLTVTQDGDPVIEEVTQVWRTDANGTYIVRTLDGLLPATSFVLEDYEAALAGPLTYTVRVRNEHDAGPATIVVATVTTALDVARPWLSWPQSPSYSLELDMVRGYTDTRASMSTMHDVIDRADPLVTLRPLRTRAGELELWCASWEAARDVVTLMDRANVLLLRQPDYPGLDLWWVPVSVTREPYQEQTDPRRWGVRVQYRETRRQTGPLLGTLGRDWADVLEQNGTWLDLMTTNDTWADVMSR